MILSKKPYYINESINIHDNKEKQITILFTDIVKSSETWKDNPKKMIKVIETQSILIDKWAKEHDGFICKTIGDAYMISFNKFENSIKCAIDIQEDLINNPIHMKDGKNLQLRIGLAHGPVWESTITLQDNIKLKDFFGNTVNTASRLESKVSEPDGFAFTFIGSDKEIEDIDLDKLLEGYKVDLITFSDTKDGVIRSNRLLTDIHRYYHKSIKELKGIEDLTVYKINIK